MELKAGPPSATRVLIAGADRALGELYRAALEVKGWEVEVVADARAVIARFEHSPPTVLLLNTLPDSDPVTLVEQIRAMAGTQGVVIVVLLDSVDRLDTKRLAGLDVQAWLSKTRTTRDKLAETITQLVAGRARIPADRDQV